MPRSPAALCEHCRAWLRTEPPEGPGELWPALDRNGYAPIRAVERRAWCRFCVLVAGSVRTWLGRRQEALPETALMGLRAYDYRRCERAMGVPPSLMIAVAVWADAQVLETLHHPDTEEESAVPIISSDTSLGWLDPETRYMLELYTTPENRSSEFAMIPGGKHYASSAFAKEVIQTTQNWTKYCNRRHRLCLKDSSPSLPTRVIDVGSDDREPNLHLSSEGETADYLTLSHRWGDPALIPKTERATIASHARELPLDTLPATFRDAVLFTRALGYRYLWIDSMCIVQDDADDWAREAARMGRVYDNSALTISVLQGADALAGLSWDAAEVLTTSFTLPPSSSSSSSSKDSEAPPSPPPPIWCREIPSPTSFQSWTQLEPDVEQDLLLTRGWTMQESLLAPRLLLFTKKQVVWSCNGLFHEFKNAQASGGLGNINLKGMLAGCLQGSDRPFRARLFHADVLLMILDQLFRWRRRRDLLVVPRMMMVTIVAHAVMLNAASQVRWLPFLGRGRTLKTWVHILLWYHMVPIYSKRRFTYPTDRLVALSALASRFAAVVGARYLAGLWFEPASFVMQLAWSVEPRSDGAARVSDVQSIPCDGPCCEARSSSLVAAPSWSWASTDLEVSTSDSNWWLFSRNLPIFTVLEAECTTGLDPYGAVTGGFLRVRAKTATLAQTGSLVEATYMPEYGLCEYRLLWGSPLAERVEALGRGLTSRFYWYRLGCTDGEEEAGAGGLESRLHVIPLATTDLAVLPLSRGVRTAVDRRLLRARYRRKTHLGVMICVEAPKRGGVSLRTFRRVGVCDVEFWGGLADVAWYVGMEEEEIMII